MMKYELLIRSRALASESIATKHRHFMEYLSRLEPPWRVDLQRAPSAPDPGAELIAEADLSALFTPKVEAQVVYQFRRPFRDEAAADDSFSLSFDPTKVDFQSLATTGFAAYVEAFNGYRGEMGDTELSYSDFDKAQDVDDRSGVYRVYPISFFDEQLCLRAFKLSPADVVQRLTAICEVARVVSDGALIIGSSRVLTFVEAEPLSTRLTRILKAENAIAEGV
jgi:hypothetical protein